MAKYAERTSVPAAQSRAEIERTLERFGATAFAYGTRDRDATVAFEIAGLRILFRLRLPDPRAREFTITPQHRERTDSAARDLYDQVVRQKWRALALAIKAKLSAVEAGITTIEDEFLAHIALPGGGTVGDHAKPAIAEAYATGELRQILPGA